MKNLSGKTILLTGAGGHLGSAMAVGFAAAGGLVYLNGRNQKTLEPLLGEISAFGGQAEILPFDVNDSDAVFMALEEIRSRCGRIDVLVNNAYHGMGGTLETSTDAEFSESYQVAVTAAAALIRAALPLLRKSYGDDNRGGASIINVASMYGLVSPDFRAYETDASTNPPFYGAAKAALIQLTRYLACQLAKDKIRVNALCPGPFPSPSVQASNPEFIRKLEDRVPLGRIGAAEEIKGPANFLASDHSSYVTGVTLKVDGGWTAW
ncbi:SDR family oxidoreductase [Akkermansiaceae bacterium]|nr:SDR family oxidoreductase [Akkermansiaceae bacterium]